MIISPEEPLARVIPNFFDIAPNAVTSEQLHTLHGALFRKSPFASGPAEYQELNNLRESARLADKTTQMTLRDLDIDLKSGPCRLRREITFGDEAMVEMTVSAQRPEFMSGDLFAETDSSGDSLADHYIPEWLKLWSISLTPAILETDDKEVALLTASQRMPFKMKYGNVSDARLRCDPSIRMAWEELKVDNRLSAEERLTALFRQFQKQSFGTRGLEYPSRRPNLQEPDQYSFLFDVLPSNLVINRLETAFKLRANMFFAALGLATLAALGDQAVLAVDDQGYDWIYPGQRPHGYEQTFNKLMKRREPQDDMFCFGLNLADPEAVIADWELPDRFSYCLSKVIAPRSEKILSDLE